VQSVRRKLMLWLVGGLSCGILLTVWIAYAFVRAEIGRAFDGELKQVAHAVHVREDWIESNRVRIARPGFSFAVRAYDGSGRIYFRTLLPALPTEVPQIFEEGYRFADAADGGWRVYTYVTPEGIVQVGQPLALRDALARNLSLRVILPILLLIPLLASVVLWGLSRGLAPLRKTTERVSRRDANLLEPLPTADVPQELLPLVEQINGLMARLARTLGAQRHFLADVAHELRSPLAALTLQAQLAERAKGTAARASTIAELKRGIDRTNRLVQQLLDFARLEPGVSVDPIERVDLAHLARVAVGVHAARADQLCVDLGADAAQPAIVMGNESQLRSMIGNLIDNALRYSSAGDLVTVTVRASGKSVTLEVADAGPGIPANERELVFERFHRVPGDRTSGTGLGLAIVRAVVERHEGQVLLADACTDREHPGLRVYISLPQSAVALSTADDCIREAA
jgi:two-component system OmpR family sensor kinase